MRSSAAWRAISEAVRRSGVCASCGEETDELEADHIISASEAPGRWLDPTNVQALCKPCHWAKS